MIDGSGCRFEVPAPGSPLAAAVQKLGDAQRATLGVLPYAAWTESFERGRVIVATNEGEVLGYTLFRLPRQEVVLVHLCVDPSRRREGIARKLVDELSRRFPERLGVRVKCRRDYDANLAWPRLGFTPLGNGAGRGADAALLTLWWKDHGHPNLLSWTPGESGKLPVLLDVNVFIDLHGRSVEPDAVAVREALERVRHRVSLLVAPETRTEINRNKDDRHREILLACTQDYPQLTLTNREIDSAAAQLTATRQKAASGVQGVSDLRQVATALAADIPLLVTRDRGMRSTWAESAFAVGEVLIVTPAELVAFVLSENDDLAYVPQALNGTELRTVDVAPEETHDLRRFINSGCGETRQEFEVRMARIAGAAPRSQRVFVKTQSGEPLVLCAYVWDSSVLTVELARIHPSALGPTLAIQLTEQARRKAQEHNVTKIVVSDRYAAEPFTRALKQDGFRPSAEGLVGFSIPGVWAYEELGAHSGDEGVDCSRSALLEHELRPCRIADAPLPTFLVSIRKQFADDLFGYPPHLLERPLGVALGLEQVYYRSGKSGEEAPGRILWRVTEGRGEVFACSSLIQVADGTPEDLHARYERLGVLSLSQIQTMTDRAHRRVLRVRDTQIFDSPICLRRLRSLASHYGQSLQLQSPYRLEPELAAQLMREGIGGSHG